jgi:VCBS repeat-containing protein
MATTTSGIVYSNSGAAAADTYYLTEDTLSSIKLDVMANDGGGAKTTLYSIDDGLAQSGYTTTGGVSVNTDLLNQDAVGAIGYSALGAKISINADKTIQYDASAMAGTYQSLAGNETVTDTFVYAIKMSNGTLAWTTVSIKIAGVNDAPTVSGALCTTATEDGDKVTLNLLSGASDVDHNSQLHVDLSTIPDGFTLDGSNLTIDPTADAFQHLAAGAKDTITVHYHVVDEFGAMVDQTATFKITGVNDAPTVGDALSTSATEDGDPVTLDLLTGAGDVDDNHLLHVEIQNLLTGGLSLDGSTLKLDPTDTAFQHLAEGETETVVVHYKVVDEHGASVDQTASIVVTGVNDDASITGTSTGSVTEDALSNQTDGQLTIHDVDDGQNVAIAYSTTVGDGTFTVGTDGAWTFVADNAALQHLGEGDKDTVTFDVVSKDGTATKTVTIDLLGINDDATITGTGTGSVTEDAISNQATGKLSVNDVDDNQSVFQTLTNADTTYGKFTIDASGNWTYVLDNNNADVNALNNGQNLQDTITVMSADGTEKQVVITINGHTDGVIMPATFTGGGDPNDFDANGTAGPDTISANSTTGFAYGGTGDDTINGNTSPSLVDHLYGGSGNDRISAKQGNDQLFGGSGNDVLIGNDGDDLLVGGYGADTSTGNGGADTFRFLDLKDTNDTITDFTKSEGDKIDFQAIYSGTLSFAGNIGSNTVAAHSVSFFVDGGNTVVLVDTDGDTSTAEFQVTLNGTVNLTATDFLL